MTGSEPRHAAHESVEERIAFLKSRVQRQRGEIRGFLERGDTPFLHCYAANVGAVALYEKLGFRVRAGMTFTILALA